MTENELINAWNNEESIAHIHGWDFSHIADRYTEETDLPWDYQRIILDCLKPEMKLLDVDIGGGEFLLSLHHPYENTSAAEAYPPNVELCKETLLPLGIDFRAGDGKDVLPFDDAAFDMIINRHGDFNVNDIHRMLKEKMTANWLSCSSVRQSCRSPSNILTQRERSLVTQALRFWTHGNASDR